MSAYRQTGVLDAAGVRRTKSVDDLTGRVSGHLRVVALAPRTAGDRCAWWVCRCTCGRTVTVRGFVLTRQRQQTCGRLHAGHMRSVQAEQRIDGREAVR